jgi:hypothetical protein
MQAGLQDHAAESFGNHEASVVDINDFEEYLRKLDPYSATFDPIKYWLRRHQVTTLLARFAPVCLAIPLMSRACERSCNYGRIHVHYERILSLGNVEEACTCLRNWYGKPTPREKLRPRASVKMTAR